MSDRELLELAAKASGVNLISKMLTAFGGGEIEEYFNQFDDGQVGCWNPLTDDGDALRLAVKLGIDIFPWRNKSQDQQTVGVEAAVRIAIVRVAAEIGRQMQEGGAA